MSLASTLVLVSCHLADCSKANVCADSMTKVNPYDVCLLILVIPNGALIIEREKPTWQKICSMLIKYVPKQKPNTRPISSLGGGLGLSPQLWKSSGRLGFVPLYSSSQQPSKQGSCFGWFSFQQVFKPNSKVVKPNHLPKLVKPTGCHPKLNSLHQW